MTEKKRKSFTLDEENARVCEQHDNASALVDDLLTQYRQSEDKHTVAIDLEIKQKKRELEDAKREVNRLETEIDELQELKLQFSKQSDAQLQEAKEELQDTPKEPTNPAIENWAEKLGMTPTELVEELQ